MWLCGGGTVIIPEVCFTGTEVCLKNCPLSAFYFGAFVGEKKSYMQRRQTGTQNKEASDLSNEVKFFLINSLQRPYKE